MIDFVPFLANSHYTRFEAAAEKHNQCDFAENRCVRFCALLNFPKGSLGAGGLRLIIILYDDQITFDIETREMCGVHLIC